jgi:hypothetical protein
MDLSDAVPGPGHVGSILLARAEKRVKTFSRFFDPVCSRAEDGAAPMTCTDEERWRQPALRVFQPVRWVLVTYHKSLITKSVTTGSDEDVELGVVSVSL